MNLKSQPNRPRYLRALARLTPTEKAAKVFELSDDANSRLRDGLRVRFPHLSDAQRNALYLQRLASCHNRNY